MEPVICVYVVRMDKNTTKGSAQDLCRFVEYHKGVNECQLFEFQNQITAQDIINYLDRTKTTQAEISSNFGLSKKTISKWKTKGYVLPLLESLGAQLAMVIHRHKLAAKVE